MTKTFISELKLMLQPGNLGNYSFCKVDQIVLIPKNGSGDLLNFFTHIDFSMVYTEECKLDSITGSPKSISDEYKVGVFSGIFTVLEITELLENLYESKSWVYNGQSVALDDVFETKKKFVPESLPIGGRYDKYVPVEDGLYGSNYRGNFYIYEIFSKKTVLNDIVDDRGLKIIQETLKSVRLNFHFDRLPDRIGNIVCKFVVDALRCKPKSLGENGTAFEFALADYVPLGRSYSLYITEEFDELLYENYVNPDFDCSAVNVEQNDYYTKVFISDNKTGLTLFGYLHDNRKSSDYYSQITLSDMAFMGTCHSRLLCLDTGKEEVQLDAPKALGDYSYFVELNIVSKRIQKQNDFWLQRRNYIKTYRINERARALTDVLDIINGRLLWDLEELWIVDPYLSVDDIVATALRCKKEGVTAKCLCSYKKIQDSVELNNASDFVDFKNMQSSKLHQILSDETDIKLQYRTVRGGYGVQFHDRYIAQKYGFNRARVWALGASINHLGVEHSTIQIVQTPELILALLEEIWNDTDNAMCVIFDNTV